MPGRLPSARHRAATSSRDEPRCRAAQQAEDDIGNPAPARDGGLRTLAAQPSEDRRAILIVPADSSPAQRLPVEADAIDPQTSRCHHAEVRGVPTHREQTSYGLQLAIVVQRIRVDQEQQRRALPFVHRLDHAQHGVAGAARRQQRRIGQKLGAVIVEQAQSRRVGPKLSPRGAHSDHLLRFLRHSGPKGAFRKPDANPARPSWGGPSTGPSGRLRGPSGGRAEPGSADDGPGSAPSSPSDARPGPRILEE